VTYFMADRQDATISFIEKRPQFDFASFLAL
jgi:hypothetical protein